MIRLGDDREFIGGFKDKGLRDTMDVERLRNAYEALLIAYQDEIKTSTLLAMELEDVKGIVNV